MVLRPAGALAIGQRGLIRPGANRIGRRPNGIIGKEGVVYTTTYYVDAVAGSDLNNGLTPATAWQTMDKVTAIAAIAPYTQIAFKGGQTHTGTELTPHTAGTETPVWDMFRITSYGTGRATLSPTNALYLYDIPGGWTIDNINYVSTGATLYGIYIGASARRGSYIKVNNCNVTGPFTGAGGGAAIMVADDAGAGNIGFDHVLINGCVVINTGGTARGIMSYGRAAPNYSHSDITVQNCIAHDCNSSGIVISSCNVSLQQNNVTYRCGLTVDAQYGAWMYDCNAGVIQFCESYQNQSSTVDGGGFDIDGGSTNCIIQYCYAHDNYGAGILCYAFTGAAPTTGNIIRFNILEKNALQRTANEGGILVGSSTATAVSVDVYGNTIYQTTGACLRLTFSKANTTVRASNNIFYAVGSTKLVDTTGAASVALASLIGNDYYATTTPSITWSGSTYGSVAAWRAANPTQENVGGAPVFSIENPLLAVPGGGSAASYIPQAGSPVVSLGIDLSAVRGINPGIRDYFGNTLGPPYAMGASERAA